MEKSVHAGQGDELRRGALGPRLIVAVVGVAVSLLVTGAAQGAPRSPALPNPVVTPGATNPRVTQATIHSTICVVGYTTRIRPSEYYTEKLKFHQLDSGYNLHGDTDASHYEEDHLIPLEVGGSASSVKNLWPEPRNIAWGASRKDVLENALHVLVCDGAMPLARAQRVFATNWIAGYRRYVQRSATRVGT